MEFDFFQNWYPISPVEDIDPNKPTSVTVLGLKLVIWKPKSSTNYQIFLDRCPHRLAPLSEGRIDEKTDNLMCSYHGWQFNSEGICTHIPQAEKPELINKNKENLCAKILPSRQENDLLWVWPDFNSTELANKTPLPLSPQIDASKGFVWTSMVRDLEYDWQILVENVLDPSHVPFSHHGVQGNREQARPISMEMLTSNRDLIEVISDRGIKSKITFEPPCRLEYAISFSSEKKVGLIAYCIPVSPGKSRIVGQFCRNFATKLHYLTPRWWDHISNRNEVLDGDMILLHQQEHLLQEKQIQESWKTAYQLPTGADRLVIEFRNWFDKYCGGKLPWDKVRLNNLIRNNLDVDRQVLLDRYKQHTIHCSSCRNALKNIQIGQTILLTYFAISVSGVALLPDTMRLKFGLPLIILALLGLAVYAWLKFWLQPKFYFVDYIHAER
ncbi:MAG: (2Fe-2S)-binding protein [Chloroflexi bacterium AL-N10]|nr:(2Fe-2S)-binding protein [Chloroflexi bacterium AL-N10]